MIPPVEDEQQHEQQPDGVALVFVIQQDGRRAIIRGNLLEVHLWGSVGTAGVNRFARIRLDQVDTTIAEEGANVIEMLHTLIPNPQQHTVLE